MNREYRVSKRVAEVLPQGAGTSQGNVQLGWWLWLNPNEGEQDLNKREQADLLARYADAYFEATTIAIKRFVNEKFYSDDEALPILYLLSHSIELALKAATVFRFIALRKFGVGNAKLPENTHELETLLKDLRDTCGREPQCDLLAEDTCDFIKKVGQFNVGAAFRFPFDTKEKPAWSDKPIVPMQILQHEIEIHGSEIQDLYYRLREQVTV